MKLRHRIGFLALAALVAFGLGSCQYLGVTIMDRIGTFVDDLNTERAAISQNFDPASTQDYAAIQDAAFWDTPFPVPPAGEQTYSMTVLSYSDPLNVTGTMYGPVTGFDASGLGRPIKLVMVHVGVDWYLQQLYLDDSTTATVKRPF